MDLEAIQEAVTKGQVFFTDHAVRQMAARDIMDDEAVEALLSGETIEEYPEDKYGPSCLVYGHTGADRPLHVLCSAPPRVRIITVYEPDPEEWHDNRIRRK